ncbi:MAG: lipoate--protein ligase [Desulfovibrionaceae bacterium]|nr:lipoate--protein ligase [Desulfovibrionaceae bacterium]
MHPITYHESGSADPTFNLALEEALAEAECAGGRFMLWQNAPSVIIGRHQNARSEVNLNALNSENIRLVRRLTGGGAVYHDLGNLNFSFVLPRPGGKDISAPQILQPMLTWLRSLGLDAELQGRNDISLKGGGKISGLASRRLPGKFLLHGTLLYNADLDMLSKVLLTDPEKYRSKGVQSTRARVCNLSEYADISLPELWQGIKAAYLGGAASCPGQPAAPIPKQIMERAKYLQATRYSLESWNLGMSPPGDIRLTTRFSFGSLEINLGTEGNVIRRAAISGDFLTSTAPPPLIDAQDLAGALLDLPADTPHKWIDAWKKFDFSRIFFDCRDGEEIFQWLRNL